MCIPGPLLAAGKPQPKAAGEGEAEIEASLKRLSDEERAANADVAELEDRLTALAAAVAERTRNLKTLDGRESDAKKRLAEFTRREKKARDEAERLLVKLWPAHVRQALVAAKSLKSWDAADREFHWLAQLHAVLRAKVAEAVKAREFTAGSELERAEAAKAVRAELAEINAQKDGLLRERLAYKRRLADLRTMKRDLEAELGLIMAAVKETEHQVRPLAAETADEKPVLPKKGEPPKEPPAPKSPPVRFEALKGRLPWPVKGSIAQKFNPMSKPPKRGVAIAADEGVGVLAPAFGRVVHEDVLRGFGKVVVLAHGDDYYTLYAFLAETKVKTGDEIAAGKPVGQVGFNADIKAPGMYFELRFHQKPVNPELWMISQP